MNEMGDKVAVLAAGLGAINLAAPGAGAILTIFLASLAIVRRDGRVDQPADPQGAAADRDRLRADRARRIELGPHPHAG